MPFKKYKSLRLKEYNYSQPGVYFVTICTKDRKCLFGEISGDEMILNEADIIAHNEIVNITGHYHNIEIGENIAMPNHIQLVVYIYDLMGVEQTVTPAVFESGVGQAATPTKNTRLQDLIGSYKSGVTREIRKTNGYENFKWQRYFHDHVVRTDRALENISDYIRLNPMKWAEDIENELYITGITDKTRTNKAKFFYRNLTI